LKKKAKERTSKDLLIICKFLEKTELLNKLKSDNTESIISTNMSSLLFFCAVNAELEFILKGETIFRIDDPGDKFYIILKGTVNILKPVESVTKMTREEYFRHLFNLKLGDNYLLNQTVKVNFEKIPLFAYEDLDKIDEIIFHAKLIKNLYKFTQEEMNKFLHTHKEYSNRYKFVRVLMNEMSYESFVQEVAFTIDPFFEQYLDIIESDKISVTVIRIDIFMKLHVGQYFGDVALENKSKKRNATLIAEQDCFFAVLDQKTYSEQILEEKQRIKNKEITFLNELMFFQPIKRSQFEKKYFHEIIYQEYTRGEILFKEKHSVEELIIIKEGVIELSTIKNILELHHMTKTLTSLDGYLADLFVNENNLELNNKPKDFIDKMTEKKKLSLFKYSSREVMGVDEIFFGLNHLYNATVISERVKVYKISIDLLNKILQEEKNCHFFFKKFAFTKVTLLVKRLFDLKNSALYVLDKSYSNLLNGANAKRENSLKEHENFVFLNVKVKNDSNSPNVNKDRKNNINDNNVNSLNLKKSFSNANINISNKSNTTRKKNLSNIPKFSYEDEQLKLLKKGFGKIEKKFVSSNNLFITNENLLPIINIHPSKYNNELPSHILNPISSSFLPIVKKSTTRTRTRNNSPINRINNNSPNKYQYIDSSHYNISNLCLNKPKENNTIQAIKEFYKNIKFRKNKNKQNKTLI
jgi:CRP-like cAMP-binding protein